MRRFGNTVLVCLAFFARGAHEVWHFSTGHIRLVSKLQNLCWALSRRAKRLLSVKKTGTTLKGNLKMKLQKGKTVYCVFEKRIKPFDVQAVRIADVRASRGNGLTEVELENGIVFRGSNAKDTFLYEDKERLSGAPAKPTRANVVIFTDRTLAVRHLTGRGATALISRLSEKPLDKQEPSPEETDDPDDATSES